MKPAVALVLGVASTLFLTTAQAEVYQWKDSSGHTIVSDTPPPGSASKDANVIGKRQSVVKGETASEKAAGEKPADAPKTLAEKDLEFKKRQQEAREKAEKEAKAQKNEADRQENCRRAKGNLAALESGQLMGTIDENGQRKAFDEAQRQQEKERAREIIAESCK
ncbi:MAG: DUF4124 domain-containing protein [Azonexus sp.]|jgi:hypothetical protein|nr:DUF4124 domain-containing protein [Azonexus sp.]